MKDKFVNYYLKHNNIHFFEDLCYDNNILTIEGKGILWRDRELRLDFWTFKKKGI